MRSPRLLAVLSTLLAPSGVRLHGSKLNLKAPEFGSPVEWHQDWAFYPHTNDDLLAVGVLLDDATEQNGPLMVLPGSHRGPTFDHHGSDGLFCGAMSLPRRARLPACRGPDRPGRVLLVPPCPCRARLGAEHVGAIAQPAAVRVRGGRRLPAPRHPRLGRFNAVRSSARRPWCRASSIAPSACRCLRRRTRARSTRTRRRCSGAA